MAILPNVALGEIEAGPAESVACGGFLIWGYPGL